MATIHELLPSSDSDDDDDEVEELGHRHGEPLYEEKPSVLTPPPAIVKPSFPVPQESPVQQKDVKPDISSQTAIKTLSNTEDTSTLMETPLLKPIIDTAIKCPLLKQQSESLWKPMVKERVEARRNKWTTPDAAMEKERFLLRKMGQDELADLLYKKRNLIKEHINKAEEIIFDEDEDISSVRSFIEERYRLCYGLDDNGHPRQLSEAELEERDFLIDNSMFITKVILRIHNLDPDDYKGKIDNFHMLAKIAVFRDEKAIRDKELEEMNKERQRIFYRNRLKSEQLARARAGEESDDDDVDDMDNDEEDQAARQAEIESQLIKKMKELKVDINPEQVAVAVSDMIASMSIHPVREHYRTSSPPPQPGYGEHGPIIDLPWSEEEEQGDDELLECDVTEEICTSSDTVDKDKDRHEIIFDWSEDIFPDEDAAMIGEKRPLDVLDILDPLPKRKAFEKDGRVEQKDMDTTPPPVRLRSCLRHQKKLLTDVNEMQLSVKDRIKWREKFEEDSLKKKKVCFLDFVDPRNKCRFYLRPLDVEVNHSARLRRRNFVKDISRQADYVDCSLVRGHQIIRKYLRRAPMESASESHCPEYYLARLAKQSIDAVAQYTLNHPPNFLDPGVRELKTPNGLHLPAYPGKNPPQVMDINYDGKLYIYTSGRSGDVYDQAALFDFCPEEHLNGRDKTRFCTSKNSCNESQRGGSRCNHRIFIYGEIGENIGRSSEVRAHYLSCFREEMREFRQNRAGISAVRHIDNPKPVAGILILSDSTLKGVQPRKLSNAVLERFHPTQGVEDMLEVLDRCPYEELDIRHCVLAWGHDLIVYFQQSPIVAAGRTIAALIHLYSTLERKKQSFEQEGYRRRKSTCFWALTIPEIGDFAKQFAIFNNILRVVSQKHPNFQLLDWAQEVERWKPTEKRRSLFTKVAVEARLTQLFDLCRRELDLAYFRYSRQKRSERQISYDRLDYNNG